VTRAAEQDRPDVQQARAEWLELLDRLDCRRLVFLDETWASTNMARTHGYAPLGERLLAAVPFGHWKITTFVAGLTTTGFIAPMVLDGAMDGLAFAAYIEQVLACELRRGDLVIMDNLPAHKTALVRQALEAAGIRYVYLPPYSPDLNPIEKAFSKLKRLLRTAAERTVEGLWTAIGRLIDQFRSAECRNYFQSCGYAATNT
jgi:transposase